MDSSDYAKAFDGVDHNKLWKILKEMGIPDHLSLLLFFMMSEGFPEVLESDSCDLSSFKEMS